MPGDIIRLGADENFDNAVIRGLRRRRPDLDIVRIQEFGLRSAADPTILEWAAQENRILLTHDVRTMRDYAYARVAAGQPMPGVCAVRRSASIGEAINAILRLLDDTPESGWAGQVLFPRF